jgi:hypothetical protein
MAPVVLVLCLFLSSLPGVLLAGERHAALDDLRNVRRVDIVDITNTILGEAHIVGPTEIFLLLHVNDGHDIVALPVEPSGFPPSYFSLGFTTSDCTGQAYLLDIHRYRDQWLPEAVITSPGHTLWVRDAEATPEPILMRSYLETACYGIYFPDIWVLRARAVVDLDTLYTPPFRLRVAQHPSRR